MMEPPRMISHSNYWGAAHRTQMLVTIYFGLPRSKAFRGAMERECGPRFAFVMMPPTQEMLDPACNWHHYGLGNHMTDRQYLYRNREARLAQDGNDLAHQPHAKRCRNT
jgi:hypothetical protein